MPATRTQTEDAADERARTRPPRHHTRRGPAARAGKLSEDVFQEIEDGQRAAIQAVKKFVATVDRTLPPETAETAERETVVGAAMDMADKLVHVQYDFLRKVVRSAGRSIER